MTFKVTLISFNFERYKSSSRMIKFSDLQETSVTNILFGFEVNLCISDHVF